MNASVYGINRISIVVASEDELAPFLASVETVECGQKAMLSFRRGEWNGYELIMAYSGVGPVNAAIAAEIMIECFGAEAIIDSGTSGGLARDVRIMDTIVSERVSYHDLPADILTEYHPWLPENCFRPDSRLLALAREYSSKAGYTIRFGATVSGSSFIEGNEREEIRKRLDPLAVDMESAAVAQVCHASRIPFLSVRTVTDTAEHDGIASFEDNCLRAARQSADAVLGMLGDGMAVRL